MTSPGKNVGKNAIIDPDRALYCWLYTGSLERAIDLYEKLDGYRPSTFGLRNSAKKCIITNPDKARKYFIEDDDYWKDDDHWNRKVIQYAMQVFYYHSRARDSFLDWIEEHELERYAYYYQPRIDSIPRFAPKHISA